MAWNSFARFLKEDWLATPSLTTPLYKVSVKLEIVITLKKFSNEWFLAVYLLIFGPTVFC
uniref:Uncharacterized protein n=1 Tax=Brassica oleracea TaxID=3712 RepID=A0A3P6BTA9_BRAOL|nr:unnamed protein product [Brassica oleracea]